MTREYLVFADGELHEFVPPLLRNHRFFEELLSKCKNNHDRCALSDLEEKVSSSIKQVDSLESLIETGQYPPTTYNRIMQDIANEKDLQRRWLEEAKKITFTQSKDTQYRRIIT